MLNARSCTRPRARDAERDQRPVRAHARANRHVLAVRTRWRATRSAAESATCTHSERECERRCVNMSRVIVLVQTKQAGAGTGASAGAVEAERRRVAQREARRQDKTRRNAPGTEQEKEEKAAAPSDSRWKPFRSVAYDVTCSTSRRRRTATKVSN